MIFRQSIVSAMVSICLASAVYCLLTSNFGFAMGWAGVGLLNVLNLVIIDYSMKVQKEAARVRKTQELGRRD